MSGYYIHRCYVGGPTYELIVGVCVCMVDDVVDLDVSCALALSVVIESQRVVEVRPHNCSKLLFVEWSCDTCI